jgi:mono/diheme cytochrome c family protein
MKRFFVRSLAIMGLGLFFGCADSYKGIPEVTPKMAMEYGVEEATLARGRGIYMAHCAACHERVHPGEIDPEFWRGVTHHMAVRAKLKDFEEKQLLHYVMAAHAEVHGLDPEG